MLIPLFFALGLAQTQDLTLSLGAHTGPEFKAGQYFGANYALRITGGFSGDIDFMASPNRKADFVNPFGSRDVASLFLMPGVRMSFQRGARVSPFLGGGLGLASYEESMLLQNGLPYPGSRLNHHFGARNGAGVDVRVYKFAGLRFEAKDYYALRHNVALGVGLHFRWGGK